MKYIQDIKNYIPVNEQESKDKEIIVDFINKNEDVLTRKNEVAHLTSSGFIVNKNRDKVLMIHHNIYNSWGWTGGHADGDSDLLEVAIKEAKEETGIRNVRPIIDDICCIDILTVKGHIKKGKYVAPHLHLSVAYVLEADETEEVKVKEDENSGVKWVDIDKVLELTDEEHMKDVYSKLINKSKLY
ncbi:MAG: NUDIX hydrolase [Romboutsia sp.]|nr:NUDIX hydrolase [Romboutsia sp.]